MLEQEYKVTVIKMGNLIYAYMDSYRKKTQYAFIKQAVFSHRPRDHQYVIISKDISNLFVLELTEK